MAVTIGGTTGITIPATATNQSGAVAWVNFNGVTTATIRASYNVASVTRTGTGQYTVTLTNALADANAAPVVSAQYSNTNGDAVTNHTVFASAYTGSSSVIYIQTSYSGTPNSYNDCATVALAVYR